MNEFLDKKIEVTQIRGTSGLTEKQKANLIGLGLKRIGSRSELKCDSAILGMAKKVSHLIEIKTI